MIITYPTFLMQQKATNLLSLADYTVLNIPFLNLEVPWGKQKLVTSLLKHSILRVLRADFSS
jgi:hypothetical protein